MASASDWANGYLAQARADLSAASQPLHPSVRAMLFQMSLEKIAKAALLKTGQWSPANAQTTHRGASHMMTQLLRRRVLAKIAYKHHVVEYILKPMVDTLENLHPTNAKAKTGPWLEYPWLTPAGEIATPCANLPDLKDYSAGSNRSALLQRFAEHLITHHDRIFA